MKQDFSEALQGKKIPILTLDKKWYRLLDARAREEVSGLEQQLNALLKRQGKLNVETKEIKKLKKQLMNEIVSTADQADQSRSDELEKKLEQNKKMIGECNERLEEYRDELKELPLEIERINFELMLATMEHCYSAMQENREEIREISEWVAEIRVSLKKRLIRKQEMERKNQEIYSYMHDVFGADVIDLFDMRYHSEEDDTAE